MQGLAIKINQKKKGSEAQVPRKCEIFFFLRNGRAEVKENNSNDTLVRCEQS